MTGMSSVLLSKIRKRKSSGKKKRVRALAKGASLVKGNPTRGR